MPVPKPQPRYVEPPLTRATPHVRAWTTDRVVMFLLIMLAASYIYAQRRSRTLTDKNLEPQAVTARGDLLPEEKRTIAIFEGAAPSVVYITNIGLQRNFFSMTVEKYPRGAGSGFIYNKDGYVVTNFHVIANSTELQVALADQSQWKGKVVGFARDKDLAVIKIDAPQERLHPIAIGTSSDLKVGQSVYAIGNPFGLDHTLTTGIVSALDREIESFDGRTIEGVIQTDAAINPGNSGGPLLDSAGRLIGVNTQIASPVPGSAGVGFAVPVDTISHIIPQLIRHGQVIRPTLGATLLSDRYSRYFQVQGVILADVPPESSAAKAGLRGTLISKDGRLQQLGDVIVGVDDRQVMDANSLLNTLDAHEIGDIIEVRYVRNDKEQTAKVTLEAMN